MADHGDAVARRKFEVGKEAARNWRRSRGINDGEMRSGLYIDELLAQYATEAYQAGSADRTRRIDGKAPWEKPSNRSGNNQTLQWESSLLPPEKEYPHNAEYRKCAHCTILWPRVRKQGTTEKKQ